MIEEFKIGGYRLLSAELMGANGWQMTNVEAVDGLINATNISGTISSDYIHSIRPIKALTFAGNTSSNVQIEVRDSSGNQIGSTPYGGAVLFSTPRTGYSLHISLPTNGYIDRLETTHLYGEPASDILIDFANDSDIDWAFPSDMARGHYAWQTQILSNQAHVGLYNGSKSVTVTIGPAPT
ncbi:MAG: hypothetical protein ACJZ5P_04900, partial [Candidatus Thalassarchaeaceae archaeon]